MPVTRTRSTRASAPAPKRKASTAPAAQTRNSKATKVTAATTAGSDDDSSAANNDDDDDDDEDDNNKPSSTQAAPSGRTKRVIPPKKVYTPKNVLPVQPLLAHTWDLEKGRDPTGWHMSEKLDGVRAIWTGTTFLSRLGNPFYAPAWFTKKLPKDRVLDGELFTGRGDFQRCVGIVRTQNNPDAWKFTVSYRVFDIPSEKNEPFEDRMKSLKKLFEYINGPDGLRTPWLRMVDHEICKNKQHLMDKLDEMTKVGGEGMMIREPGSKYEEGRSKSLLKVKKFLDCDAIVRGYEDGQGRNQGVVGALKLEMLTGVGGKPNGTMFKCGSGLTDKLRSKPPKIGTVVIVKYQELSKSGNPRFPTFQGVRAD